MEQYSGFVAIGRRPRAAAFAKMSGDRNAAAQQQAEIYNVLNSFTQVSSLPSFYIACRIAILPGHAWYGTSFAPLLPPAAVQEQSVPRNRF
jgi:hypothetical protein